MKQLIVSTMILAMTATTVIAQRTTSPSAQQVVSKTTVAAEANAFNDLMQGNRRFVKNQMQHPHQNISYVQSLSKAQHPKAIVLSCADSRVTPEILFDQGLGDLFVIRNAGNVIDDDVLGSMEYAIEHLGVRTIVVLGHENCGAVTATVNNVKTNNHVMEIEKSITPAYKLAEKEPGDKIHNTVVQNVALSIDRIKKDKSLLPKDVHMSDLKIYGAVYDMANGTVKEISH